jgi:hypothetical protein
MKRTAAAAVFCAGLWAAWMTVAGAQGGTQDAFGQRASFRIDKAALRAQGAAPALIESVAGNAYRYFRLLARQFASRTCFEFRDLRWRLPSLAVHGDAHLEQFVSTSSSFGLEDFDMAGYGPSVVDLVRYAASLHVACRQVGFPCNSDQAVAAYFAAYHAALDQKVDRVQPGIVERQRIGVPQDHTLWLRSVEALMRPIPAAEDENFRRGWPRLVQLMREAYPERPVGFFDITRLGGLQIGVGSALETKTLIRIAGPTPAPDDDLMLEARSTAVPDGQECVARPTSGGSLHVLLFAYLLGQRLPEVFGFMPREGAREAPELWVQSWDRGYRELSVSTLQSQDELNDLAVDAGRQLAGHLWTMFPEPLRAHQRFSQLRAFELTSARARDAAREFADETLSEWERFRRQP